MGSVKPVVCIVTPGTEEENNGNWRTAARWSRMLGDACEVILQRQWSGPPPGVLVALHARRSAASIAAARKTTGIPLVVVLTGTDLYRDLPGSIEARASLDAADRIVVLQEEALNALEPAWRAKARVIVQSAESIEANKPPGTRLACVAVGHLRDEKDPQTLFEAMRALPADVDLSMQHIGAPLDASLATRAAQLARTEPRYRYDGPLPHAATRAAIAAAHVLVHPSRMEGGANVIVEAITAGTAVVASRIAGNVGMLGADYPGFFPSGDASALRDLLVDLRRVPARVGELHAACEARRPLFAPERERAAVRELVHGLLA